MTRPCVTCNHPQRREIDTLLAIGTASAEVARRFNLGERAVRRHADNHLPIAMVKAAQIDDAERDLDVLTEVKSLYWRTKEILDADETDSKMSLAAVREARPVLALLGELLGELDRRPQVNVLISPQWITIRTELLKALIPYPEARAAVAARLIEVETVSIGE